MDYKNLKPLEALYLMQFEGKKISTRNWYDGCYMYYDTEKHKFFNHHRIHGEQEIRKVVYLPDSDTLHFHKFSAGCRGESLTKVKGIFVYEEPKKDEPTLKEKKLALFSRCLDMGKCSDCGLHQGLNPYSAGLISHSSSCPVKYVTALVDLSKASTDEMYNRLLELEAEESEPSVAEMRKELEDFCDTYEHCEDCPLKDFMNSYTHFKYECKGYNVNALSDEAVKERYRKMVEVTK